MNIFNFFSAWKFTPDSVSGKRLMQRCRQLLAENEEAGKMISSGRIAKLEGELSMQKALCEEMKKNQMEMDDFVQELDDDMEGMQNTIYFLQQQLKEAKETIANFEVKKTEKDMSNPEDDSEMSNKMAVDDAGSGEKDDDDTDISDKTCQKTQEFAHNTNIIGTQKDDEKSVNEQCNSATENTDNIIEISFDEDNKEDSEIDNSFQDESIDDKSADLEHTSMEETSESSTSVSRGRGKRGTPTKLDKTELQNKGRRSQRTTRGQKRAATNSADDEKSEKEDGVSARPKRTRGAPREEQEI